MPKQCRRAVRGTSATRFDPSPRSVGLASLLLLLANVGGCADVAPTSTQPAKVDAVKVEVAKAAAGKATISGVVNALGGSPLADATVSVGEQSTKTDATGTFTLQGLVAGNAIVHFAAAGYVSSSQPVTLGDDAATSVGAVLAKEGAAQVVDATAGGKAADPAGTTLVIPAGALVDAAGKVVTGPVDVHLTSLNPTDASQRDAYPAGGDLSAINADGGHVMLSSIGVVDVTIRQNGEDLNVGNGQKLALKVPQPAALPVPTAEQRDRTALWYFDDDKATWVYEGVATYDAASNSWDANLAHLSVYNIDRVEPAVSCVRGTVVNGSTPRQYVTVKFGPSSNGTYSSRVTDANGRFCGFATLDTDIIVDVFTAGVQTRLATPFRSGSVAADMSITDCLAQSNCTDLGTLDPYTPPVTVTPQCKNVGSTLDLTIRDFRDSHPDFEENGFGKVVVDPGIVKATLDSSGKPVYDDGVSNPTISSKAAFDQWFRDVPDVNMKVEQTLTLSPDTAGRYVYDSNAFFPIDNLGFGNEGRAHNYHFTVESHSRFKYVGGESFTFSGDDDVFLFINKQLAIDLGGVHGEMSKTIELDALAATLGLTKGGVYAFDLFYVERHTAGSNFHAETTISCLAD